MHRLAPALVAVALCLAAPAAPAGELTDAEVIGWLIRIRALERTAETSHGSGEILLRLADAYGHIGDEARARATAQRAVRAGVEATRAKLVLGDMAWRAGRYDEATRQYLDVLASDPDQPHALTQLWKIVYTVASQGLSVEIDPQEIVARLEQAGLYFPARPPTAGAGASERAVERIVAEANALLARNLPDAALAQLERAAGLNPGASEIYRALARTYLGLNDPHRAQGATLLYLTLRPDAPDASGMRRWLFDHWRSE